MGLSKLYLMRKLLPGTIIAVGAGLALFHRMTKRAHERPHFYAARMNGVDDMAGRNAHGADDAFDWMAKCYFQRALALARRHIHLVGMIAAKRRRDIGGQGRYLRVVDQPVDELAIGRRQYFIGIRLAGQIGETFIFCVPGSTGACRDAWDLVLALEFDSRFKPC